jgi:hypothetical protein
VLYCHIQALRLVLESLPEDVTRTVPFRTVGSRLAYCNSRFASMSKSNFVKLQRMQNTLACVVLRKGKCDHFTLALRELHWLLIDHCSTFKLATLKELLHDYKTVRDQSSSSKQLYYEFLSLTLYTVFARLQKFCCHCLQCSLPDDIRI